MANSSLFSQINSGAGTKWVHDASSMHGISPASGNNASTFIIQYADPDSAYSHTASLAIPAGIALKSDIQQVMLYKGTVASSASLSSSAATGWVYVANATFSYNASTAAPGDKAEIGDMFVRNNSTSWPYYDVIQTNIDPSKYAAKGHTHSVTVSGKTGDYTYTPAGTISVTVTGGSTTFKGSYTPEGTVTVGTFSFTGTAATVSHTLSLTNVSHTHTFNGTPATISVVYKKAAANTGEIQPTVTGGITASYTPAGGVEVTLTSNSTQKADISGAGFASHNHSFTGTAATISVTYKKANANTGEIQPTVTGGITASYTPAGGVSVTLTSNSSEKANITNAGFASHNHSFTGTAATISVTYKKVDTNTGNTKPTVTGGITASYTPAGGVSVTLTSNSTEKANITNAGFASHNHSFTGTAATISVSYSKSDDNTGNRQPSVSGGITASYTPAGDVAVTLTSNSTEKANISGAGFASHSHSFNGTAATITVSGTPKGTVSKPGIGVTLTTGSITYATGATTTTTYTLTSTSVIINATYTTASELLTFNSGNVAAYSNQTLLKTVTLSTTTHTNVTGVSAALNATPEFYGSTSTFSGSYTPAGTVSATSGSLTGTVTYHKVTGALGQFTGTAATITSTFSLTAANHSHSIGHTATSISTSYTPAGTIGSTSGSLTGTVTYHKVTGASGEFTGTNATITSTFSLTAANHSHSIGSSDQTISTSYTPAGTIGSTSGNLTGTVTYHKVTGASGEFTGTNATITSTFSLKAANHSHSIGSSDTTISTSYTPAGTIGSTSGNLTGTVTYHKVTGGSATFTGTNATITSTFSLKAANHSHSISSSDTTISTSYTPAGTLSANGITPSLIGGITVSYSKLSGAQGKFTGSQATVSVSGTPQIASAEATFYGTAASHSHSFSTVAPTSTETPSGV